jgi:hypothetical protein
MAGVKDELLKKVPCICPQCGKSHTRELRWTGKLPARVRCIICNSNQSHGKSYCEEVEGNPYGMPH